MDIEAGPPAGTEILEALHPNQLAMQQSRLVTDLLKQTESQTHLLNAILKEAATLRKWVTFFGVLAVLSIIGWLLVLGSSL